MRISQSLNAPSALVGRDREHTVLREHLTTTLAGHGSLVLIGGEAGSGKTALAEALCSEAEREAARVLIGRCYDLAETPPFGPWAEARAQFPPVPDLPPLPSAHRTTAGSPQEFFTEVRDFFAAAAAIQPLVLLLDDLQWADPISLELLRFLARYLAAMPLLILATYRPDDLPRGHPLAPLLPLLVRESHADRIELSPLSAGALRDLLRPRYALAEPDEERLVAYLVDRTEGNALFVTELLRALEERGVLATGTATLGDLADVGVPTLLREVVAGRVARLGREAERLLGIAAVIGQEVPSEIWARVGEVDDGVMEEVAERALGVRLLVETREAGRVAFAHALIREALYAGIPAIRRGRIHRRAAEVLAEERDAIPDAVAYHFRQAGDRRGAEWLVKAGERAQRAYAWLTAADRYQAALAMWDGPAGRGQERARLLLRLAVVRRFDDRQQSLACLKDAERLIAGSETLLAARIRLYHGLLLCFLNELAAGVARLREGIAIIEALPKGERTGDEELDVVDATTNRGTLVLWLAYAGRLAEAETEGERYLERMAVDAAHGVDAARYADAYFGLGVVHALRGRPDMARRMFGRARDLFRAAGHFHLVGAATLWMLAGVAMPYHANHVAERERIAREVVEAFNRVSGMITPLFPARATPLPLLSIDGNWEAARALSAASRANTGSVTDAFLGQVALAQGDRALVEELIAQWLPGGPATPPGSVRYFPAVMVQQLAIQLALDAGDLAAAEQWLRVHDDWLEWSGAVLGQSEGHALWAVYHRRSGDTERANERAERALSSAIDPRQPLALLGAHRLLGALATDAGRYGDAGRHLGESLALADACKAPYERALTLLAMATLQAATADRNAARALLDEVRAICDPLGAQPAIVQADVIQAGLGAERHGAPPQPFGLSARELEVLRLVARGLTNPQVAQQLFLSPRTVNAHLASIYTKLGVSSRTAAAHIAHEHGLV